MPPSWSFLRASAPLTRCATPAPFAGNIHAMPASPIRARLDNSWFVTAAKSPLKAGCAFGGVCEAKSLTGATRGNSAGVATYETRFNDFKELGSKLANLKPGLANVCSSLFYCEGLSCEVHLINCLRVALNFSQGQVSANRCNLMCGAARFR